MNKVPYCNSCLYLKEVDMIFKTYYCGHEDREHLGSIGVDKIPPRSPKWCPLRNNKAKQ